MEYLIIYLILGLIVSIIISEIDKIKVDDGDCDTLDNVDRILYVIIWPLMTYFVVKGFINESPKK